MAMNEQGSRPRELVSLVFVEAVGSSMTPFVPVPFADDYLFGRLLRRITRKVVERDGSSLEKPIEKAIVASYLQAGDTGVAAKAVAAAARLVVRKVAVLLDVKKSHDVFGEAIAYALALDVAVELGAIGDTTAVVVGGAIYHATQNVGSAALEVISRATAEAFKATDVGASNGRFARVADAIGKHVDDARAHLDHSMRYELARSAPTAPR